jgi:phosphoribosylanthranilate isomerase
MRIKVCGMRDHTNIAEVVALRPDYLGFIFYRESPRYVGDDFVMPSIDSFVSKVGVFVNATTEEILAKAVIHNLHMVQLHGHESVEQCEELRAHNTLIIKAFSVDDKFNFEDVKKYHTAADYFLFDTKGKYFGGNATRFDWSILTGYDQQTPFFLSGGLKPENIEEVKALNDMNIHAIDINSGVEISPGLKDPDKIKQVMHIMNEVK